MSRLFLFSFYTLVFGSNFTFDVQNLIDFEDLKILRFNQSFFNNVCTVRSRMSAKKYPKKVFDT